VCNARNARQMAQASVSQARNLPLNLHERGEEVREARRGSEMQPPLFSVREKRAKALAKAFPRAIPKQNAILTTRDTRRLPASKLDKEGEGSEEDSETCTRWSSPRRE